MKTIYEQILEVVFTHNEIPNIVVWDVSNRTKDWIEINGVEDCDYLNKQLYYLKKFILE